MGGGHYLNYRTTADARIFQSVGHFCGADAIDDAQAGGSVPRIECCCRQVLAGGYTRARRSKRRSLQHSQHGSVGRGRGKRPCDSEAFGPFEDLLWTPTPPRDRGARAYAERKHELTTQPESEAPLDILRARPLRFLLNTVHSPVGCSNYVNQALRLRRTQIAAHVVQDLTCEGNRMFIGRHTELR